MAKTDSSVSALPNQKVRRDVIDVFDSVDRFLTASQVRKMCDSDYSRRSVSRVLNQLCQDGGLENRQSVIDRRKMLYGQTSETTQMKKYRANDVNLYIDSYGYRVIKHHHKGDAYIVSVHRLVALAEYGFEAVVGCHVHHKNKHPIDNRPTNLSVHASDEHTLVELLSTVRLRTDQSTFESLVSQVEDVPELNAGRDQR
jgi:hypothetical protein